MTGGAIYLCPATGPLVTPNPDCPNAADHTPCPDGYLAWHAWAAEMAWQHWQRRCTGCDLYVVWVPLRVTS